MLGIKHSLSNCHMMVPLVPPSPIRLQFNGWTYPPYGSNLIQWKSFLFWV